MIDNYDSFAYNLVQYFAELGCDVLVKRNDEIGINEIRQLNPQWIVISPVPCTPNEAGISLQIITELADEYPILGVCLGHQSIAQAFGGKVVRADEIMHGKVSEIIHDESGIFKGIASPLAVTRYHSLIAEEASLPDCLQITSRVKKADGKGIIMSIQHKSKQVYGVQFHPESILTDSGHKMLKNFLEQSKVKSQHNQQAVEA